MLERLVLIQGIGQVVIIDASDVAASLQALNRLESIAAGFEVTVCKARIKGRAAQLNQGIARCHQRNILCLHCDTALPENTSALLQKALQSHRWGRFDLKLDAGGLKFRVIEFMINLRSRLTRLATGDQAMFFERAFLAEQNGFANIALMEDVEFCNRVSRKWPPALIKTPVVTSARRWQQNGIWRTILLMWKLRLLYRLGWHPQQLATMYQNGR